MDNMHTIEEKLQIQSNFRILYKLKITMGCAFSNSQDTNFLPQISHSFGNFLSADWHRKEKG